MLAYNIQPIVANVRTKDVNSIDTNEHNHVVFMPLVMFFLAHEISHSMLEIRFQTKAKSEERSILVEVRHKLCLLF